MDDIRNRTGDLSTIHSVCMRACVRACVCVCMCVRACVSVQLSMHTLIENITHIPISSQLHTE